MPCDAAPPALPSNVTRVWVGDTVTIDGTTHVGVTFYTADGARDVTPDDGSLLAA